MREASFLSGGVAHLSNKMRLDAEIDLMVLEAHKTSEIEGEHIDAGEIRSSIKRELGMSPATSPVKDERAIGISRLMLCVRDTFAAPLTQEDLFQWHEMIMLGRQEKDQLEIGNWRRDPEPMQVISGPMGHEKVHFEAPPSERVPQEMARFIQWFNESGSLPGPLRAALAHLYFESIHPFSDGNGRIGRTISEKALSQDLSRPILFSLSAEIMRHRKVYYEELSRASHYNLNITRWLTYFVRTIYEAQELARKQILFVVEKSRFCSLYKNNLNVRQEKVIQRMFKSGVEGFKGGMSAQKYAVIAHCSKATATRDLRDLVAKRVLFQLPGGGRSTRYALNSLQQAFDESN